MLVCATCALCAGARLQAACDLQATASVEYLELRVINDGTDVWTDVHIALYGPDYFPDGRNALRFDAPPSALRFGTAIRSFKSDSGDGFRHEVHRLIMVQLFAFQDVHGHPWMRFPDDARVFEVEAHVGDVACHYLGTVQHQVIELVQLHDLMLPRRWILPPISTLVPARP